MGKSRHTKGSWRGVNVQDVDNFLEDQRLQERLGTNFSTKPDHELFVIDTEPSAKQLAKTERLTRLQRKRLVLKETPRCFRSLENTSKVPAISSKTNCVRPVTLSRQTIEKKVRKGIFKKKEEIGKKNRQKALAAKDARRQCRSEFTKDLWADEVVDTKRVPTNEWFSKNTVRCNTLSIKAQKPPRKGSCFLPVDLPHPGTSYNPTFVSHQELLQDVVKDELKVIKEEQHLNRVTSKMFRQVTKEQCDKELLIELQAGLEQGDESEEDNSDYKPINPPVVNKKKDLIKKRNMRAHNLQMGKAKEEAVEKRKHAEIYKLRFIKDSLDTQDKAHSIQKLRKIVKKETERKTPQIGSSVFKEPPAIFSTSVDLSGNLRNIIPQGGGLPEQFTSFQRRGLTSVSMPRTLKKKATKKYTLPSHRLPSDQIEMPVKTKKKK